MNNFKRIVVGITLSLTMFSAGLINACSEEKEVKVTEEINTEPVVATPVEDKEKNVNVDVHVENPQQPAMGTKSTDVTIIDRQENTKLNNEVATVNANLQKLQAQINSANAQTKADLNRQIQQMNAEKIKLQQQMAALEAKNREANAQAQKAAMENNREQLEKTKQEFIQLSETRLDTFEKKMDTLKDKLESLEATQRTEVDKQVSKIDEQKDKIADKVSDLNSTIDATSFRTIRTQIDTMIADLERSYNRLVTDRVSLR